MHKWFIPLHQRRLEEGLACLNHCKGTNAANSFGTWLQQHILFRRARSDQWIWCHQGVENPQARRSILQVFYLKRAWTVLRKSNRPGEWPEQRKDSGLMRPFKRNIWNSTSLQQGIFHWWLTPTLVTPANWARIQGGRDRKLGWASKPNALVKKSAGADIPSCFSVP